MSTTNGEFLTSITPSRDGLLAALRPSLTSELILAMAYADVPIPSEVEANNIALTAMRNTGMVPGCLQWNPGEACNILRWQVYTEQPVTTMKLFASWILVRAYMQIESKESGNVETGDEHTLAGLVEAALDLGDDYAREAASFLYWAYLSLLNAGEYSRSPFLPVEQFRNEVRPFYLFGLLILAASIPNLLSNEELLTLIQKLDEEEQRVHAPLDKFGYTSTEPDYALWLLGLAENNVGGYEGRCYNLAQRAASVLQQSEDETRSHLLDDILGRWAAFAT